MQKRRAHLPTLPFLLLVAALLASSAASCRKKAPSAPSAPAEESAAEPASQPQEPAGGELETLRSRVSELEAELAGLERKLVSPSSTVQGRLMGQLDSLDGPGLYRTMKKSLLAGEEGHQELLEFFAACDKEHEKILTLTHDSRLVFALLRLVAHYPAETAALCAYMIHNTREQTDSFIRREIYNFLPVFLNYHGNKYPELRQLLKDDIVFQLQKGGDYLYKLMLAMRDLQFKPPIESMLPILYNNEKRALHGAVIAHLAGRGDEGLQALIKFTEAADEGARQSVSQALKYIVDIDAGGRKGLADRFLEHENPVIRLSATFYYFRHPRKAVDYERALGYLNSEITVAQQSLMLGQLKRNSPVIYQALVKDPGKVKAEKARAILEKAARKEKEAADEG